VAHHITGARGRMVLVFESASELFSCMTSKFREISSAAIAERQAFAAALSGGETPAGLYREIADAKGAFDWEKIHIFLADERFVPPADSRSNFAMIKATLLDQVPIPAENVHPVPFERSDPDFCARLYEDGIRAFFRILPGTFPAFDLIMLGLGEDGHTASLFPGTDIPEERVRMVRAVPPSGGRTARITLTLPVINNARNVIFLVTGRRKAEILKRLVEGGDAGLPAARVAPEAGEMRIMCDREAASLLRGQGSP